MYYIVEWKLDMKKDVNNLLNIIYRIFINFLVCNIICISRIWMESEGRVIILIIWELCKFYKILFFIVR